MLQLYPCGLRSLSSVSGTDPCVTMPLRVFADNEGELLGELAPAEPELARVAYGLAEAAYRRVGGRGAPVAEDAPTIEELEPGHPLVPLCSWEASRQSPVMTVSRPTSA